MNDSMPPRRPLKPLWVLVSLLIVVVVFFFGFYSGLNVDRTSLPSAVLGSAQSSSFSLVDDVWDIIEERFVNATPDKQEAVYGAIRGMIATLDDPYTTFFDPEESQVFQDEINGVFEGIGAEIGIKNDQLVVVAPLSDSPAEEAGLQAGDAIHAIDGASTAEMSLDEAVGNIRGDQGTTVVLTITRGDDTEPTDIPIVRASITVDSVVYEERENNIVHISLRYFGPTTGKDFSDAVSRFLVEDQQGLILDLRSNPGGYLDAAIDVAGEWVAKGTIVAIEEHADNSRTEYQADTAANLAGVPTVVLIDGGSASGSEIVAGALQDYSVATLIGTQTFGKGSVQQLEELPGGSSLKVTIARWLTPDGRTINESGITPDIDVELTEEDFNSNTDPQLDRAIEYLLEQL